MKIRAVAAALALLAGAPAAGQGTGAATTQTAKPAAQESTRIWSAGPERLLFVPAAISVPRRAGTTQQYETKEFSHPGEGLDAVLQLRSADQAVFASVYFYLPSIAHPALQAIATDNAIRTNAKGAGIPVRTGVAAAGGTAGAAVTAAYRGYLGSLYTTAAFVKVGRWMVKVRVSGPQAREAEVTSVMTALLDGLKFEGTARPLPAPGLEVGTCVEASGGDARLLADADLNLGAALIAHTDPAASDAPGKRSAGKTAAARIGRSWCRATLEVGDARVPMLRASSGGRGDGMGARSELLILYSDAGGILEVVELVGEKKHLLLNHSIGETQVMGTFDGVPSVRQLRELFTAPGENARVRAVVRYKANGDSDVTLIDRAKASR